MKKIQIRIMGSTYQAGIPIVTVSNLMAEQKIFQTNFLMKEKY